MATSEYEELRRRNLEDNKRILAELGLANPYNFLPKVIKKGIKRPLDDETYTPERKKAKRASAPVDLENSGSIRGSRRLSARLRGHEPGTECIGEDDEVEDEHEKNRPKYKYVMPDRPNWYGEVPGVDVGTFWQMRIDCSRDGIHRPTVAGIHGGPEGAYSLALSGGYEDDIDLGDCFTYTGEGGRDLKGTKANPKNLRTAAQSRDQDLTRGNLALSRSVETGNPVRVIRGYKLRGPFAPDEGYRYDGLYTVQKFWFTKGLSGFGVYKFALKRCGDQAPPPWEIANADSAGSPSKSSDSGFSDNASSKDGESVCNDNSKPASPDSKKQENNNSKPASPDSEKEESSNDTPEPTESGKPEATKIESMSVASESVQSEEPKSAAENQKPETADDAKPSSDNDTTESVDKNLESDESMKVPGSVDASLELPDGEKVESVNDDPESAST